MCIDNPQKHTGGTAFDNNGKTTKTVPMEIFYGMTRKSIRPMTDNGLNLYQFGARMYDPSLLRFITPDPLRHETPHLSSYLYCAANPVMYVDPTGMSTWVVDNGNGTLKVVRGELDGDRRVFLCKDAYSQRGYPIGVTPVETSFYNSDEGKWMVDAIIDMNDSSGDEFITSILVDTPGNKDYALNAYGGKLYDFKRSNGTSAKDDDYASAKDFYRGMCISITVVPQFQTFCSARDIGNIMPGYVAGHNLLSWGLTRFFFDSLQSYQDMKQKYNVTGKWEIVTSTEGISSQNAQKFGYDWGLNRIKTKMCNETVITFPYTLLFKN